MPTSNCSCRWKSYLASWLVMGGAIASCDSALAQIIRDRTLGSENSVVTPETPGSPVDVISGGATRGKNLFHSFEQFSIQTGSTAFFNNATNIQNIISRVTGSSISNIDGLIKANGAANLFLLNPNGIIFGQNARLDIRGSFLASTASSFKFADGLEFSAKAPENTPLLTINVPIGLQFEGNPGSIQVLGDGQGLRETSDLVDTTTGLRVSSNQTLALVGGNLSLEGATLKTAGGRIELGSVAGDALVNLTPTKNGFALGYEGVQNLGNIQLTQQSAVDVSGAGGGDVQVTGKRVTLTTGSQIEASTLGSEAGGALVVNASELLDVIGTSADGRFPSGLGATVYPGVTGNAGDLTINTNELLIQNGAQVGASTFGSGTGGNVTVTANKIRVIGRSGNTLTNASVLATTAERGSTGDAGLLTINTGELEIRDGAFMSVSTRGTGKAGDLTITADSVQVVGISADGQFPTTIGASSNLGATGDAGSLTIKTKELLIKDGARVQTVTSTTGKGGSLTVTADKVEVISTTVDGRFPSTLSTQARSTGDAGNMRIKTQQLLVRDGAGIFVQSLGTGNAGNLTIDTDSIRLDNGTLTADTRSVNTNPNQPQATITLRAKDLILLRRNSNITTNATGSNVIGGNINIDTDFLVATENSDISANSTDFRGGRVTIKAFGIFGTQFRNTITPESDITATGASPEFSGTVELNILDVDPNRGLVELPVNLIDVSQQIAQSCTARSGQTGSFVITGRGGLPDNPSEMLGSDAIEVDLIALNPKAENQPNRTVFTNAPVPIVEAQWWVIGKNGEVQLIASAPIVTPNNPGLTPESCNVWQQYN